MDHKAIQKLLSSITQGKEPFIRLIRLVEEPTVVWNRKFENTERKLEKDNANSPVLLKSGICCLCGMCTSESLFRDVLEFDLLLTYFPLELSELCQISFYCKHCHAALNRFRALHASFRKLKEDLEDYVAVLKTVFRLRRKRDSLIIGNDTDSEGLLDSTEAITSLDNTLEVKVSDENCVGKLDLENRTISIKAEEVDEKPVIVLGELDIIEVDEKDLDFPDVDDNWSDRDVLRSYDEGNDLMNPDNLETAREDLCSQKRAPTHSNILCEKCGHCFSSWQRYSVLDKCSCYQNDEETNAAGEGENSELNSDLSWLIDNPANGPVAQMLEILTHLPNNDDVVHVLPKENTQSKIVGKRVESVCKSFSDQRSWTPYPCNLSNKTFYSAVTFDQHFKTAHPGRRFICLLCNRHYLNHSELLKHEEEFHTIQNCKHCGIGIEDYEEIQRHLQTHLQEEHLQCLDCNEISLNVTRLEQHYKVVHLLEEEYICRSCGLKFQSFYNLLFHLNLLFKCTKCHQFYKEWVDFQEHAKSHVFSKIKCDKCLQVFESWEEILKHLQEQHARPFSKRSVELVYNCRSCITFREDKNGRLEEGATGDKNRSIQCQSFKVSNGPDPLVVKLRTPCSCILFSKKRKVSGSPVVTRKDTWCYVRLLTCVTRNRVSVYSRSSKQLQTQPL